MHFVKKKIEKRKHIYSNKVLYYFVQPYIHTCMENVGERNVLSLISKWHFLYVYMKLFDTLESFIKYRENYNEKL